MLNLKTNPANMRIIILFITAILFSASASAQTDAYRAFMNLINKQDEVLVSAKKIRLAKGETDYAIWKVKAGEEYTIYCWGEDEDITDADVMIYSMEKELLAKDVSNELLAIAHVEADEDGNIKVVGKNSGSNNPGYQSLFHIMLCRKN